MLQWTSSETAHLAGAPDAREVDLRVKRDNRRLIRVGIWAFDAERVDPVLVDRLWTHRQAGK